jgi:hypothetical protein
MIIPMAKAPPNPQQAKKTNAQINPHEPSTAVKVKEQAKQTAGLTTIPSPIFSPKVTITHLKEDTYVPATRSSPIIAKDPATEKVFGIKRIKA